MPADNTFEIWMARAAEQLAAMQGAGTAAAWSDLSGFVETFQLHLESQPPGDLSAAAELFTEARSVVDSLVQSAQSAMAVTDSEIRELYRGRKALKAYR